MTGAAVARSTLDAWLARVDGAWLVGESVGRGDSLLGHPSGLGARHGPRVLDLPAVDGSSLDFAVGAALGGRPVALDLPDAMSLLAAAPMLSRLAGAELAPLLVMAPVGPGPEPTMAPLCATGARFWHPCSPSGLEEALRDGLATPGATVVAAPAPILAFAEPKHAPTERPTVLFAALGAALPRATAARDALARDGIAADVLPLGRLAPIDAAQLGEALRPVGRLVVVHDDAPLADLVRLAALDAAFEFFEAPPSTARSVDEALRAAREALSW